MKKLTLKSTLVALAIAASLTVTAQTISFPQPSPTASFSQNFATSKIEVSYSRPGMKGRKIFGDVVPFGKLWRTGANGATTISFGEDVKLNGSDVKAGKYGLLTIPGESEWTVIITKDLTVTSEDGYKKENDVVRFTVKPTKSNSSIETFTIEVANIKNNEADIDLKWENTVASIKVTSDYDARIAKQIDEVMAKDTRPYSGAASYYLETGRDLNKSLEWINKAIAAYPGAFWNLLTKAKIQVAMKDYNGAMATSQQSWTLAKEGNNDAYMKMNEELQAQIKANPAYKPAAPAKKKS
ncbi:MAG: DUF2911 domain-containing protein [Bacteroidota bacterium]